LPLSLLELLLDRYRSSSPPTVLWQEAATAATPVTTVRITAAAIARRATVVSGDLRQFNPVTEPLL